MRNAQSCAHPIVIGLSIVLSILDSRIISVSAATQTVRMLPRTSEDIASGVFIELCAYGKSCETSRELASANGEVLRAT